MRGINIANENKRDAKVGFEVRAKKSAITMKLSDGRERRNIKFIKTTGSITSLVKKYGDMRAAGNAIISDDPELDIEAAGKIITKTRKLYVSDENTAAYRVNLVQILYNPDGTEKERRDASKAVSNIAADIPVKWSGREFPKAEALRKFVFTKKYQLRHTSGITFDFLYDMAKQLHEHNALMFVGGGRKGNEPIILSTGGEPYRGFLEGRIDGDRYCLILHLTGMELRSL
ncbi:hypothetical protein FACS189496_4520 [Bacilli bacterium]|nr:hypothetical protein FACS189496_4520 [Bacilli bacterium]